MKLDGIRYLGIKKVLERNSAVVLEENHQGIFVKDTRSEAYMLATENLQLAKEWMKKHEKEGYSLVHLFDYELCEFVKERYHLNSILDCYQVAYLKKELLKLPEDIIMHEVEIGEIDKIMEYYDAISKEEMQKVIEHHNLFWGREKGKTVGFVGEHLEGSMGILYVFPEYRKNGNGRRLEQWMIRHTMEQGFIPFGQVEISNIKSINLQKKLGMDISEEHVYWMF